MIHITEVRFLSACMVSLVAEKFTNKRFPSDYTSEAPENIFAQNPSSVFFIRAYIYIMVLDDKKVGASFDPARS